MPGEACTGSTQQVWGQLGGVEKREKVCRAQPRALTGASMATGERDREDLAGDVGREGELGDAVPSAPRLCVGNRGGGWGGRGGQGSEEAGGRGPMGGGSEGEQTPGLWRRSGSSPGAATVVNGKVPRDVKVQHEPPPPVPAQAHSLSPPPPPLALPQAPRPPHTHQRA